MKKLFKNNRRAARFAIWASALLLLGACMSNGYLHESIDGYKAVASRIALGQSEEEVLRVLQPTQARLSAKFTKPSEEYMLEGKRRKIYFFRSRSFPDGLVTDDEFTPYVFEEGTLIAIGWTAIGGPKTQAQTRERDYDYHFHGRVYNY